MRLHLSARALRAVQSLLPAILALAAGPNALAQTTLAATTHTVVGQGLPPAVEHDFTITKAGSYSVTLTDLGSKLPSPAPLASVAMAVTQGGAIVATPVVAPGTPITFNATANTTYTIHVIGSPGTSLGSGPIEEDVTDSGGNRVFSSVDTLSVPSRPPGGLAILSGTFPATAGGTYSLSMTDFAFPAALTNPNLILIDTTSGTPIATMSAFGSSQVTLSTGDSYQIIAFAQQQSSAAGGLFGVSIGPAGSAAYGPRLVPAGSVTLLQTSASGTPESSFTLAASGATLALTDLSFPTVPLSSVGVALIDVTSQTLAGSVTGTGQQNVGATSGSDTYQVYAYAVPDSTASAGSYAVVVQQGTSFPFATARAVSSSSTIQAFNFDAGIPSTGSYALTLTDFKFPVQLTSDALAVVQNGQLVKSSNAAGNFPATLSRGPVTLLAFGAEGGQPASPGLMGIDLSPVGGGAAVLDVTEGIGAGFSATSFTAQSGAAVQANVADLGFPAPLASLNLAVTSGTSLVGSIASAGSSGNFPFQAAAGTTYNINVLAQPAAPGASQGEQAGTYAMSVAAAPVVTLSASSSSITSGGTVTLTWSAQNATSCTASASPGNSGWSGSESPTGGSVTASALAATTDFSLSCTGPGGSASQSVTVTVDPPSGSGKSGGGGALDVGTLLALAALLAMRWQSFRGRMLPK